jgi:hypothetical protein
VGGKLGCFRDRETIAQGVQDRAQGRVRLVPPFFRPLIWLLDFLQDMIGLVHGRVE